MYQFSLNEQLGRAAGLYPDRQAVVFEDRIWSWSALQQLVAEQAAALAALAVGADQRVAVLAHNSDLYFALYFAIPALGATIVPINIRLAQPEIVDWLQDCSATVLLVDEHFLASVETIRAQCPDIRHTLYIGRGDCPGGLLPLLAPAHAAPPALAEQEVAALFYTGGTTGRSKGVMQTHQGMVFNTLQWIAATGTTSEDNLLIAAPMFHLVAGMNCVAAAVLAAKLVILPRFDAELTLRAIQAQRITKTALVPAMVDMLIRHERFADFDITSLKKVSYGGAPMPEGILERAQAALPGVEFIQIYGQTECCGTVTCLPHAYHTTRGANAAKRRSAGRPVAGCRVAILAPDGQCLPAGEVGEICVRSPASTPGYWRQPENTAALYEGGWLHTGDLGYLDSDGFLFIVDRLKDMIVTGGENVFAGEVENVIYQLKGVLQCAVIGIPSERWGETVHAVIYSEPGCSLDEAAVIEHCRKQLANYKCVRSVEFRDESLPVSAMNKILKQKLRDDWCGH
ncbi:long-chain-fatty-acid--CoA ligase [Parahaliea mediterranea]|uniref:long-chain-fatty-acid--CoA ligase n=1 Tax=Parahaliea mediterranea TaxID=651086 RepID=UPI000E2FED86|nr:long-chain-fatty-acid--CoA ligase [Parahaliea mediterranea]